jgi:hypothetical protein
VSTGEDASSKQKSAGRRNAHPHVNRTTRKSPKQLCAWGSLCWAGVVWGYRGLRLSRRLTGFLRCPGLGSGSGWIASSISLIRFSISPCMWETVR